jgi:hypothetical protein
MKKLVDLLKDAADDLIDDLRVPLEKALAGLRTRHRVGYPHGTGSAAVPSH